MTTEHRAYFAVDVETDGSFPARNSMLEIAVVYAGYHDPNGKFHENKDMYKYIVKKLQPVTPFYEQEAVRVTGFDREWYMENGEDPDCAMADVGNWIENACYYMFEEDQRQDGLEVNTTPVMVAWPLSFDWLWTQYYFGNHANHTQPFLHSNCIDLKTYYAMKKGLHPLDASLKTARKEYCEGMEDNHSALAGANIVAKIFTELMK